MSSPIIAFLSTRKSAPINEMTEPGPSDEQLETMLRIASRVPDHGKLAPWRFILYRGEARLEVGKHLVALAEQHEGPLAEGRRHQEATRFSRAPLVIGVVFVPKPHPKIPDWEKFLSAGAAAMNLCLAANALGFATNWISNWYSDDPEGRRLLGLRHDERVAGFVHVGTHSGAIFERPRPDLAEIVSDYAGPTEA
ncbi:nitroreductase family protein [Tianweitania sediminis]|uniref:Putative NAD(P)H nitroreductase n=1 Tax=Tianweitania sediminis TaxID=1502156 RepID=A0A8J7R3I4_9HYPH|nr:nitroreductase [Tianweitania sediminis]MBP0439861.1 nitroreductase [Tianweitania sediminis]